MAKKELKLKNCPFCGSAAELKVGKENGGYKVVCTNFSCIASFIYRWFSTEEAAIDAWERRANNESN